MAPLLSKLYSDSIFLKVTAKVLAMARAAPCGLGPLYYQLTLSITSVPIILTYLSLHALSQKTRLLLQAFALAYFLPINLYPFDIDTAHSFTF